PACPCPACARLPVVASSGSGGARSAPRATAASASPGGGTTRGQRVPALLPGNVSGRGNAGTAARGAGKPGGSVRAESGDTWTRFDEADTGGARRPSGGAGARPRGVVSSPVSRGGGGGAGRLHPLRRHAGAHH